MIGSNHLYFCLLNDKINQFHFCLLNDDQITATCAFSMIGSNHFYFCHLSDRIKSFPLRFSSDAELYTQNNLLKKTTTELHFPWLPTWYISISWPSSDTKHETFDTTGFPTAETLISASAPSCRKADLRAKSQKLRWNNQRRKRGQDQNWKVIRLPICSC